MKLKLWLASLLVALVPAVASAVTILDPLPTSASASFTFLPASTSASADFQLNKAAKVAFALTGTSATKSNLTGMTFNIFGTDYSFSEVTGPVLGLFDGSGNIGVFTFGPGNFTVTWGNPSIIGNAQAGFTVIASPIPLPAAGWMLVAALGGMGFLARRQKTIAA